MKAIFEALLTIVVGLALLPVVREFVGAGQQNATSAESTLLILVTLFWVLGIIAVAAAIAYKGWKK